MAHTSEPTVSIVIPMRNEEQYIAACLSSIVTQDYPNIIEILVLDGRSTDCSTEIVKKFAARDSRIRLLDNPRRIQPAAMNIGLQTATADIIVRMDAHAHYARDYVSQCVKALLETNATVVGGILHMEGNTFLQRAIAYGLMSPVGVGTISRWKRCAAYGRSVSFGAYWRQLALEIGGYNERIPRHEDVEFHARVRKAGGKILRVPEIAFTYYPRSNLKELWRQTYSTGRWTAVALRENPDAVSLRQLVPAILLIITLCIAGLALFWPAFGWALASLTLAYMAMILAGSLDVGLRHGWHFAVVMPLVFLVLHLSSALGTLASFAKWGRAPEC